MLRGVTPEMRIYREESFGPSVSIIEVDSAEEAIRVANDTEYGLSASIFSRDVEAAPSSSRAGSRAASATSTTPPSTTSRRSRSAGSRRSGWGRFGGEWAAEEFTELRWITIQDEPREYPI